MRTKLDKPDERWLLPKRLRRGLREALDGGHGKLRMDPEDLADLLGKAIDMEVERLARIREEHRQALHTRAMFRQAERYVAPTGARHIQATTPDTGA